MSEDWPPSASAPFSRIPSNQEWAECKAWTRQFMSNRRELEGAARREWIEGVRRRLGLVAEVHRCRVWKRGEGDWAARCLRPGCPAGSGVGWAPSQQYALGDALAHAGAFLPLPPEEAPVTELDVLAFDAAWADMRTKQDVFAAALPDRIADVTELVNEQFAGVLPDGVRFEWGPVADRARDCGGRTGG